MLVINFGVGKTEVEGESLAKPSKDSMIQNRLSQWPSASGSPHLHAISGAKGELV